MKSLIILRGVSGSGKTTFAELMSDENTRICCADDYFFVDHKYVFDVSKLGEAHAFCREQFDLAVHCEFPKIIIANTNTTEKEFAYYETKAKENGYRVFHIVMENRHGSKDVHDVPTNTIAQQKNRLMNDIRL